MGGIASPGCGLSGSPMGLCEWPVDCATAFLGMRHAVTFFAPGEGIAAQWRDGGGGGFGAPDVEFFLANLGVEKRSRRRTSLYFSSTSNFLRHLAKDNFLNV